jgi:tetratricopeptide (TPR) repeat protein/tRNA A-37 threonylcarbamoyl transferase component Bud32
VTLAVLYVRAVHACPSDEELVLLLEGVLEHTAVARIETHVDRCAACASLVANLGAIGTPTPADHRDLSSVDPDHYVFADEIARGGMGRILRARDRRLGREVAIKENFVKQGAHARRFEREARITARLQHPSIVQVHEAGVWPTGEPFFSMQLVAGRPFSDAIAEATTLDKRLALLPNVLAVADAIAYAHSQDVIHRDLKPRNVIVGEFGETIVIDWGLAKLLNAEETDDPSGPTFAAGSGDDRTEAGTVMGTPAYMPPEQALGEPVDQRADVYALGALLFHVLAGRPPVIGSSSNEMLATIVAGDAPSLADIQPGVPPDLLAIVAKATAHEPANRYPSARELAADLRKFQTGQLVSAHRYSRRQLVLRWLRRHRTAMIVAAVAVAVVVTVGIVSVSKIVRAEHVAEDERREAERNRGDAEELMSFMLGDLREKLQPIGKLEVLETVAKKATAYYEQRPDSHGFRDLQQRAVALGSVGDVLLAQGHTAAAVAQYRVALAETEALAAANPGDERVLRHLAVRHNHLGSALFEQGDTTGALVEYRADMAITSPIAAAHPNDVARQRDLSVTHEKIADTLFLRGDFAGALAEYRASLAISEHIAVLAPSAKADRDLAIGHGRLAEALAGHEELAAAIDEDRAALAIRVRLAAADPSNTDDQRGLSALHNSLGELLETKGSSAEAISHFRAAQVVDEKLAARDPTNVDWVSDLAFSHANLGKSERKLGDDAAALIDFRAALAIQERLAAQDPTHADRERDIEISHKGIGDIFVARKQLAAARTEYDSELAIAEKLAARDPSNAAWQRDLGIVHEKLGHVDELGEQWDAAAEHYRMCMAIRAGLAARDPSNFGWVNDLAVSHYNLGEVLAKRDVAAAIAEHRMALEVSELLLSRDPDNKQLQGDVADSKQEIAKLLKRR